MNDETVEAYRRWAEYEARGTSELYREWANGVAADATVVALLDELPRPKRQPNLLFAAARYAGAPLASYSVLRDWLIAHWGPVRAVMESHATQTNEAGRCATVLPLLERIEGPVALIEVGASAGLCLYPDRYSYRYRLPDGTAVSLDPAEPADGAAFDPADPGDRVSPVVLDCDFSGARPPVRLPDVVWRAGIDLNPLDVAEPETLAWLEALVWPEHSWRLERLRAAASVAVADPPLLVAGDLVDRLPALVAQAPDAATVVVFHSAVLPYLPAERRSAFIELMGRLGESGVRWISNEALAATWIAGNGGETVDGVAARVPAGVDTRGFVASLDGVPIAATGPHGQYYAELTA